MASRPTMMSNFDGKRWIDGLSEEDLAFVKRFILSSGSLKEMASIYGVSYPTVRLRLDRLIEKIKVHDDATIMSEFERRLRGQLADGKLDMETFRLLLDAHRQEVEDR